MPDISIDGLPWWCNGKESPCQCRRQRFESWSGKTPCTGAWQPVPAFLPGKFHAQRNPCSPWGRKEPPRPSRHAVSEDSPSQEFKSCSPKCLSSGLVKGRVECIAPPRAGRGGERERDARRQLVMKLETRGIRSLACIALQIQRAWVPSWVPCPSSYPKQSILNQKGI